MSKKVRILEVDGGGMKGLTSAYFAQQFFQHAKIEGTDIGKTHDIIGGTSIGALSGAFYAMENSPDDIIPFFTTSGPQIFSSSSGFGGRASKAWKATVMVFGGSVGVPSTFYNNTVLVQKLLETFGDTRLGNVKPIVLFPSWEATTQTPYLMSNANIPGLQGSSFLLREVVAASAAAPLYFPSISIAGAKAGYKFIDGGVYQNNTTSLCLSLASVLYPDADSISVLSIGTGLGELGFDNEPDTATTILNLDQEREFIVELLARKGISQKFIYENLFDPNPTGNGYLWQWGDHPRSLKDDPTPEEKSNMAKLMDLIDIGITGPQEAVAKSVEIQSYYGARLGNTRLFYYRFQPQYNPKDDTELDNTTQTFFDLMKASATQTFQNDIVKINAFIRNTY